MFEAYINALRMRRMQVHELSVLGFRHLRTVCPESNDSAVQRVGWSKWVSDADNAPVGLVWCWGEIQHGAIAIDPFQIQSNLLLLCGRGKPLSEGEAMSVLVSLVSRLDWQPFARKAAKAPRHGD